MNLILLISLIILALVAIVLFISMTRSGKALRQIRTDKENFEHITQQSNDALLVIDIVNGRILTANPKLSELIGHPYEQLTSLTVFDLHPKEMLARSSEIIADVWEKKGMIYSDIPLVTATGEVLPVECSARVISYNRQPAILIYARDIRERLRMEKEIRDKNRIIEQKNKDITDSINYAKRIQQAILSDRAVVKQHLPESFIYFRPKDIVSGDFYWFSHHDGATYLAAADCTGHGVPGAFMSMIANSFLNEVVNEKGTSSTSAILEALRDKVVRALRQKGEVIDNKDGLDIALCSLKGNELSFSGANNPLWRFRKGELTEFPADKQPIGLHPDPKPFRQITITVEKGDSFYMFTDGFADQFGGPKRKKFMYRRLAEYLQSIQSSPMEGQKQLLDKTFEQWRNWPDEQGRIRETEQIDDVLVIGFRI